MKRDDEHDMSTSFQFSVSIFGTKLQPLLPTGLCQSRAQQVSGSSLGDRRDTTKEAIARHAHNH